MQAEMPGMAFAIRGPRSPKDVSSGFASVQLRFRRPRPFGRSARAQPLGASGSGAVSASLSSGLTTARTVFVAT